MATAPDPERRSARPSTGGRRRDGAPPGGSPSPLKAKDSRSRARALLLPAPPPGARSAPAPALAAAGGVRRRRDVELGRARRGVGHLDGRRARLLVVLLLRRRRRRRRRGRRRRRRRRRGRVQRPDRRVHLELGLGGVRERPHDAARASTVSSFFASLWPSTKVPFVDVSRMTTRPSSSQIRHCERERSCEPSATFRTRRKLRRRPLLSHAARPRPLGPALSSMELCLAARHERRRRHGAKAADAGALMLWLSRGAAPTLIWLMLSASGHVAPMLLSAVARAQRGARRELDRCRKIAHPSPRHRLCNSWRPSNASKSGSTRRPT